MTISRQHIKVPQQAEEQIRELAERFGLSFAAVLQLAVTLGVSELGDEMESRGSLQGAHRFQLAGPVGDRVEQLSDQLGVTKASLLREFIQAGVAKLLLKVDAEQP